MLKTIEEAKMFKKNAPYLRGIAAFVNAKLLVNSLLPLHHHSSPHQIHHS